MQRYHYPRVPNQAVPTNIYMMAMSDIRLFFKQHLNRLDNSSLHFHFGIELADLL